MTFFRCVYIESICDNLPDCPDASDEINCTCEGKGLISCGGNSICGQDCIPKEWICDGFSDCPEGEDEQNCTIASTTG